MVEVLRKYEKNIYAGILAKTALKLSNNLTDNQKSFVDNENKIIESIIDELSEKNNLSIHDDNYNDKLLKLIDEEIDNLLAGKSDEKVLLKLAEKAELPSDLYKVIIINNIETFYGKNFKEEEMRITKTVKSPDREMHFGPPENEGEPFLISLFSKVFIDQFPRNNFTLLVVGQRNGLTIIIHQVWRIYHDIFPNWQNMNLIDLLEEFSNQFGAEIEVNGKKGKFFLTDEREISKSFNFKPVIESNTIGKNNQRTVTFSYFIQKKPDSVYKQASLIVAVDLEKYKSIIEQRKW